MSVEAQSMSKPSLAILFDRESKIFFSGEMITGVLKFEIEEDHKVQLLSVNLNAEYCFTKTDQEEIVELIYTETCHVDVKAAGEAVLEMPFTLVVRPNSPTSLAFPLGGIRYCIVSALMFKVGDKVQCKEVSELVSVNTVLNLPKEIVGKKVTNREKGFLLCCCGSLLVDLEVDSIYLLCGQSAIISACIFNGTRRNVQMTSLSLVQRIVRQRDRKISKVKASSKERGSIMAGKRQVWLSERFLIPPLPPSTTDDYFKISYWFVMEIQKNQSVKCMKVKIPVVIGNLPYGDSLDQGLSSVTEGMCSNLQDDTDGFKPLYVMHVA